MQGQKRSKPVPYRGLSDRICSGSDSRRNEREEEMLFYCRFTWYPGVSRAMVARRLLQQDELGTNHPERIKAWYTLAGGGAGFMLVEANQSHEVSAILEPYMDLMSWDVHAVAETPYEETIEQMRKELAGS
jgi:hypothetical protein